MVDTSKTFNKLYKQLNQAQKAAVDTLNGPVMVVAGPGTGKTQILTLRIANILQKTDADPGSILAITFTETGAKAMRERLASIIGKQAYYVNITTFHSFASSVINDNPDFFYFNENARVIGDLERLQIFEQILDEQKQIELLKPTNSKYFYVNSIISAIKDLKREGVTLNKFEKLIVNNEQLTTDLENKEKTTYEEKKQIKDFKKQIELSILYEHYEVKIKELGLYDFEDMINYVNEKLENEEELAQKYQEKFQYILVDEFQDTNNAQYSIIKNLTSFWGQDADVFVVGDDDQSIYRFQGASVANMLDFQKDFVGSTLITLKNNYRSTQLILDASRNVISNNQQSIEKFVKGIDKALVSQTQTSTSLPVQASKIQTSTFSNGLIENYYIATQVKKLIDNGEDPSEIAVLFRHNSDSNELAEIFSKLGIFYNLEGGQNILKSPHIAKFLDLLKVIEYSKSNTENLDLFTILSYNYLGFDYLENLKLAKYASTKRKSIEQVILEDDFEKKSGLTNPTKYSTFIKQTIVEWQNFDAENPITRTFEKVLEESGYLQYMLSQKDSVEEINKINTLYNEVQRLVIANNKAQIKDLLEGLTLMEQNNIGIYEKDLDIAKNTVTLSTAHKSKGLEFKHVFIYAFNDKKWGNNPTRELIKLPDLIASNSKTKVGEETDSDPNEDERRLFYVALTRAKQSVYISRSNEYQTPWGVRQMEASMFLLELPKEFVTGIDTAKIETKEFVNTSLKTQLSFVKDHQMQNDEKEYLDEIVKDINLSVTALNTYLECGYKFKLNNLLRTPRAKTIYLSFGTAVHKALEEFYNEYLEEDTLPDSQMLVSSYLKALEKEVLTESEREALIKKGKSVLANYHKHYSKEFKNPEYLERLFGYGFAKIYVGDTPIVGKVDRIEQLKKEDGQTYVKVIDYKTGKPKSKNEIEGKTKYSDGGYKRQLVFYKLLCDLDKTFKYKAEQFELDFVEPNDTGKYKKEVFIITEEEVKELKEVIIQTMKDIRELKFERTTDYLICGNCDYQRHCWPNGIPKLQYKQNTLL
ncbi:ATP-dependent helicase [bacterium]|nr:ATP-dependent helicase [bacterium]